MRTLANYKPLTLRPFVTINQYEIEEAMTNYDAKIKLLVLARSWEQQANYDSCKGNFVAEDIAANSLLEYYKYDTLMTAIRECHNHIEIPRTNMSGTPIYYVPSPERQRLNYVNSIVKDIDAMTL